jgi:predicted Ser/Thr protein kinase
VPPSDDELAATAAAAPSTDDGLGRTTTAGDGDAKPPRAILTLGRLRLERVLGTGGMGVVHAAFDPDLERRVAVKLLHASSADARARLLREARAMAKLSHPNVITVFDVGTADGEDFVTMELVDGVTLKDWIATAKPSWREIVAAFIAAGRGLAAAHDAGLVHRDFKPTNVLRSHKGKVVVTDFGLSRATTDEVDPMAVTGAISGPPSTRTQTGAVLGTPAYMAPEQWTGMTVGPASDQFAFCVALWEALAGRRPYGGDTFEQLRTGVLAGPDSVPFDIIPRPVRAIIRRGFATDPDKRWPTMHALLAALERALARRRRGLGLAAAVAIGSAGITALLVSHRAAAIDCSPPALDPDAVWPAALAADVARRDPASAKLISDDVASWRRAHARACEAPAGERSPQLACLDGVLARIDLAAHGSEIGSEGTSSLLVDPALCARTPAPHLTAVIDPELGAALGQLRFARNGGKIARGVLPVQPCARAIVLRARLAALDPERLEVSELASLMQAIKDSSELADRCADDVLRAIVLIGIANASTRDTERADAAVGAVPQDDLLAEIDLIHGREAGAGDPDAALGDYERAIARFGKRGRPRGQLRAVVEIIDVLLSRGRSADIARVGDLVAKWRPIASGDDAIALELRSARARWRLGDVAGADALAASTGYVPLLRGPRPIPPPVHIKGQVVDEAGHPVANAEVIASMQIDSDSVSAAAPLELIRKAATRSAADGTFTLDEARGLVVASAGPLRSMFAHAAPELKLVVHPTVHLDGRVTLGPLDATQVRVTLAAGDKNALYDIIAPVRTDGTFSIDGALRGKMSIAAREYNIDSGDAPLHLDVTGDLHDLKLTAQVARPLYLIARNAGMTPPDAVVIFIFAGALPAAHPTLDSLHKGTRPITQVEAHVSRRASVPAIAREKMQGDDFFTKIPMRPNGKLFACAIGVTREMFVVLKTPESIAKAFAGAELGCVDVPEGEDVVIVEVPPLRKPKLP